MSKPTNPRSYWAAATAVIGLTVGVSAGEPVGNPTASPHEDDPKTTNVAVDALVDADINWRGTNGFSAWAYPELEGANARYVAWQGRGKAPELLRLLDKPGSTVAAHVLLTQIWMPRHELEHRSERIKPGRFIVGGGYQVHYNGLEVRILWWEQGTELQKVTVISHREEQLKKIREFWKARYRDFPEEFRGAKVTQ